MFLFMMGETAYGKKPRNIKKDENNLDWNKQGRSAQKSAP